MTATPEPLLECRDVSFRYSPRRPWVLQNFSHRFGPGIHLLMGYSGCGKSTLLRLLARFLRPEQGTIHDPIAGHLSDSQYCRERIGFVFQQLNLLPRATLWRNLELAAALGGKHSPDAIAQAARTWLVRLGLEEFQHRLPISLSGGQQQRAALARALIKDPPVLLLDEPTSGLDDANTKLLLSVLRECRNDQRILILATHDHRLIDSADEIVDFNRFLPVERHLVGLV
jgi:ABC-type lipoprotein export system ATPase subunit